MNKRKKSKTTIPIDTESLLEIMNNQASHVISYTS